MKPWGPLNWLLDKLPSSAAFHVIGCVAPEERSVALPLAMNGRNVRHLALLRVRDETSRHAEQIDVNVARSRRRLAAVPINKQTETYLLCDDEQIALVFKDLLGAPAHKITLVLDITSLPKRFFFLMIKLAMQDSRVETLVTSYTQPAAGGYTREHLAEDPEDLRALPGFGPVHGEPDTLVVGIGFEPLGLSQLIGEYRDRKRAIAILMPFPPGQPYSRRIWKSLDSVGLADSPRRLHRVSALNAFDTYEQIGRCGGVSEGSMPPALAPYGPKPVSLGMCMYALRHKAPVLYTQPRVYHPNYTKGTAETWAYCLKKSGALTF